MCTPTTQDIVSEELFISQIIDGNVSTLENVQVNNVASFNPNQEHFDGVNQVQIYNLELCLLLFEDI